MKTYLLMGFMVVSQFSFGAPIFCSGGKWNLKVSSNHQTAKLTVNGEDIEFGNMKCNVVYPKPSDHTLKAFLNCRTAQRVADAGFFATIKLELPGVDMNGKLSETTFAGPRELADLKCVGAANSH